MILLNFDFEVDEQMLDNLLYLAMLARYELSDQYGVSRDAFSIISSAPYNKIPQER